MIKRLPSRNRRSKGIKVNHVLQIIVLLGVCFWLIYQVKHNHDKKEFDKDAKLSVSTQTDPILKLGRRDLHPGKHEEIQNEKREVEEEDEHIEEDEENKHDHGEQEDGDKHETEEREDNKREDREQVEEKNKPEAEEQEEDENKNEEMEDEGRGGGGDDEIDENDKEKSEVDTTDRDDEFLDEEKENEEVDEKDGENEDEEKEGLVENHYNHEAREEHYKGDDASSAVAHETSTETGTLLENSDVNLEMNITKPEKETMHSDESIWKQNDSDLKVSVGDQDWISSNGTAVKETGNNSLSNPVYVSSYLNKTATTNSDSHLESMGNLTVVTIEANNNMTGAGNDTSSSSEQDQNKTVVLSESDQAQNSMPSTKITGDVKVVPTEGLELSRNRSSDENLLETNSSVSVKTENGGMAKGESSNLVASNVTDNTYRNERSESDISENKKSNGNAETSETNENQDVDATENEMFKGDTKTDETSDSFSTNEPLDLVEQDAIDSSDTHIHEDVTEARTDLGTLPDIRVEGDDRDETAAE